MIPSQLWGQAQRGQVGPSLHTQEALSLGPDLQPACCSPPPMSPGAPTGLIPQGPILQANGIDLTLASEQAFIRYPPEGQARGQEWQILSREVGMGQSVLRSLEGPGICINFVIISHCLVRTQEVTPPYTLASQVRSVGVRGDRP